MILNNFKENKVAVQTRSPKLPNFVFCTILLSSTKGYNLYP